MSLDSLYASLERCERNIQQTQRELNELVEEHKICVQKKNQYEKHKNRFHNILEGERRNLGHLYNLTTRNKLSKKLHIVMNEKFYGRECTKTTDSLDEIYRTINRIISNLKEKIEEKKRRIQHLNSERQSIKEAIRREIERQRRENQ